MSNKKMSEKDLFKQLHKLKSIKPDAGYSAVSRLIIMSQKDNVYEVSTDKEIKLSVSALKAISPSVEFTTASKIALLNHPRTISEKIMRVFSPQNIIRQVASYSVSVGLAVALIATFIGVTGSFKPVSEIDGEIASQSERSIRDIDIHLEEANYFAISADKTRTALREAGNGDPNHVNQSAIESESGGLEFNDPTDPRIDDMLRQVTL